MEWFTLGDTMQRETLIEGYQSFIWTERYYASGDFQITIPSTFKARRLLQVGTRIAMNHSYRIMTIETVEDSVAEDGSKNLIVTGRSFEAWLEERVGMEALQDLTTTPKWVLTGTPGDIVRSMFNKICVTHNLNPNDGIPWYAGGTFLPSGTMPEPVEVVTVELEPDTLYKDIQMICEVWLLGFRIVRNDDTGNTYFDVYTGDDRTSSQSDRPPVIFDPDMETMVKTSTLKSSAALKTVAYVYSANGAVEVYAEGYNASMLPYQRKVLLVKADDIDLPAGPDLNTALALKGKIELSKNREVYAFDGEIPWHQPYIYGYDYNLGDLVEERSSDGGANYMLVTEQIFISDEQGERTYPTLTLRYIIIPGSWEAELPEEHWGDVLSTTHWGDL